MAECGVAFRVALPKSSRFSRRASRQNIGGLNVPVCPRSRPAEAVRSRTFPMWCERSHFAACPQTFAVGPRFVVPSNHGSNDLRLRYYRRFETQISKRGTRVCTGHRQRSGPSSRMVGCGLRLGFELDTSRLWVLSNSLALLAVHCRGFLRDPMQNFGETRNIRLRA